MASSRIAFRTAATVKAFLIGIVTDQESGGGMKNQAKTFEVSIVVYTALSKKMNLTPALLKTRRPKGGIMNGGGRPRKRGTPTRSRRQRNATGWSSGS